MNPRTRAGVQSGYAELNSIRFYYCHRMSWALTSAALFFCSLLPVASASLSAQDQAQPSAPAGGTSQGNPPTGGAIECVPNRPTISNTAEAVQKGVFEIEYGFEVADGHQNINGLLKFGLAKNLELRFANNPFERDAGTAGFGDSTAGFKYRFLEEKGAWPTLSVLYAFVIPTATSGLGLGSTGHAAGVLVSKDLGRHHLDFNESIQWLGGSGAAGFDHNYFTALAYSHPITRKLAVTVEIAGFSRTNADVPGTLTILQALTYNLSPRLVFDGGGYVAAHGDLPRITFFAGVTYAVGNLYRCLHVKHH